MTRTSPGRVVLVTGGARGIGRAIACDLARDHRGAITHLSTQPDGLPADILTLRADLCDPSSHAETVATLVARFGGLDVLVNDAGAMAPSAVALGAVNIPEAPRDPDLTRAFVEMTALGRLATPDDIAHAVRYLAGEQAASVTGEVLTVTGGYRL